MKKKLKILLLCLTVVASMLLVVGCGNDQTAKTDDVTILYVNDSHTYIDNKVKDKDGKETPGLSYSNVAAMKKNLQEEGKNVIVADCGDFIQGTSFGAIDKGASMANVLNAAGIDVATIGNHEFDYGILQLENILTRLEFPCVSCNWIDKQSGFQILPGYQVLKAGDKKIAFVGISTPDTITSSNPENIRDSEGNVLFSFLEGGNGEAFYSKVQETINDAKQEADYVIGLGHLGVDPVNAPYMSTDVIKHVNGFDAFIDGHSHTEIPGEAVKDKDGKDVWLTQTGSYFGAIGQMEIKDGKISTQLIKEYKDTDETVTAYQDRLKQKVEDQLGDKIAESDITFYNEDPKTKHRIVRNQETNLGDLTADSIYYMFNEERNLGCDVAFNNGGNCRAQIPAGDWTLKSCKDIEPFSNVMCLISARGQNILDALEWSVKDVGAKDGDGYPVEFGGFMQVAGIKFDIDSSIPSTVQKSSDGSEWAGKPTGEYRVKNVKIYNRNKGQYEDLELEKLYAVGGNNFQLRSGGDGFSMFKRCTAVTDYVKDDLNTLGDYIKKFRSGKISTANSPLGIYKNYSIDYENPYGSGRITIK